MAYITGKVLMGLILPRSHNLSAPDGPDSFHRAVDLNFILYKSVAALDASVTPNHCYTNLHSLSVPVLSL